MKNLILSQKAFAEIKNECLKHPFLESGGILAGRSNTEDIIVPLVIGSGPEANRSPSRFEPDVSWQQKLLDRYFEMYNIDYVGSFHRHPGSLSRPSAIDYEAAVQIFNDPDWAVDEAVFPIILFESANIVIYPYYTSRTDLKFRPMALGIVPDEHPFIRLATREDKEKCSLS